jgi:SAM-dependent methyltransferase
MDLGFRGEVAELYHQYRRGYPAAVLDELVRAFGLTSRDIVVDLGCGTGQLTLPMAPLVRSVVAVDPEPDMLQRARRAAAELGLTNVSWMVGADTDMPAVGALLGEGQVGAVTIGQALHWMNHDDLFAALVPLVREGGGVAVVTNGVPLWLQDAGWSRALRECLQQWLGQPLTAACGTDEHSQQRYRDALSAAGFEVTSVAVDYKAGLTLDQIVGGIYSAMPVDRLPASDQRPLFAEQVRRALRPDEQFTEHVHVALLLGRVRPAGPAHLAARRAGRAPAPGPRR